MREQRFEKVVEYEEFISNKNEDDWLIIFLVGLPIVSTILVIFYLIFGRKKPYWRKIK